MRNWKQEDIKFFTEFIQQNGGQILKIYELMNGYQFDIRPPLHAQQGWAIEKIKEYENGEQFRKLQ